ncbi:cytochrome P450 [Nocardia sp. NEAU-G5]|uniref:Cytochrome P450 n=1 Tax=Nocardia albiluteola TaxID=2842303 RepID=A0ABS6B9T8_9NOCA|nr:cytochrome P450 [Nocardia albiluteola]
MGHALRLRNNPLEFFESLRDYGDIVGIELGPRRAYVLNSPALIREMLVVKPRMFNKGAQIQGGKDLLGNGLLSSEGETHRRHRLMMQPAFRRERIALYAQTMQQQLVERTATWRDGQVLDAQIELSSLTLAVATKTLISSEIGKDLIAEMLHSLPRIFDLLYRRLVTPVSLLNRLPLPRNREYAARLARLHPMVDKVIADYRAEDIPRDDLLSMMLRLRSEEDGSGMTDEEIHSQVASILVAGTETAAATLCWTFHLLSRSPEAEARLHAEVDDVLGGRPASFADLPRLTYTGQVIREALRCYPPAWFITREAVDDVELGGYRIPRGTPVMYSTYAVHRDSRWYPDPERFDPDRWSSERVDSIPREAILPFGSGARKCIGDVFALVETTLAVATIATGWRMSAEPGAVVEKVATTTLVPRNLHLTLHRRSADPAGNLAVEP